MSIRFKKAWTATSPQNGKVYINLWNKMQSYAWDLPVQVTLIQAWAQDSLWILGSLFIPFLPPHDSSFQQSLFFELKSPIMYWLDTEYESEWCIRGILKINSACFLYNQGLIIKKCIFIARAQGLAASPKAKETHLWLLNFRDIGMDLLVQVQISTRLPLK